MEMLKARKAELQERGVRGFTLMEMLIVIAIIAVLIAIAIPVFTTQLNSAKVEADAANARSLYTAIAADYMTGGTRQSITPSSAVNGRFSWTADAPSITYGDTVYTFSDQCESIMLYGLTGSGTGYSSAPGLELTPKSDSGGDKISLGTVPGA